jgi:hypothetical protein
MPIQFPRPSGSTNLFAERTWLRLATKAFDVVPAPSISRVGYSFNNLQTNSGYALDPWAAGTSAHPGVVGVHKRQDIACRNGGG